MLFRSRLKAEAKEEKERLKVEAKEEKERLKAEKEKLKAEAKEEKERLKAEKERLKAEKIKKGGNGNIDLDNDVDDESDIESDVESDVELDSEAEPKTDINYDYTGGAKTVKINVVEEFIDKSLEEDDEPISTVIAEYKDDDVNNREIDELEGDELLETMGSKDYKESIKQAMQYLKTHSREYLSPEGLKTYGPKFLAMIENIEDPEHQGLHLVYSQFRTMEGIGIFSLALEANGYAKFKIKRTTVNGWTIDMSEEDMGKPCYALYTGTEDSEEREILRNIYNGMWDYIPNNIATQLRAKSNNNNLGEIIKVLMITSAGSEGINLRNTRYVHIMEPYWHPVRTEQVIGRARRICSHKDLPKELQTVEVFVYIMT